MMSELDPEDVARLEDNCSRLFIGKDNIVRIRGQFVADDMIFKLQYILQKLVDDPDIIVKQEADGRIMLAYKGHD